MTNLEYYKDEVVEIFRGDLICNQIDEINDNSEDCCCCPFYTEDVGGCCNYKKFIDLLLADHKKPVKLKQWEYDMVRTNDMSHSHEFCFFGTYRNMKNAGYFEGVYDVHMTLKEILENCIIES